MTKRQTRAFFLVSTLLFALVFLGLTIDTHRQIPRLTNSAAITPEVRKGQEVWHAKNCTNCHTLLGEGAYHAPDLTKITQHRGAAYLRQFLADPTKFFSEERDRRIMPNLNLSAEEIEGLIAFLDWVAGIDTNGWPPRPILVSGTAAPTAFEGEPAAAASNDPVAVGEVLFRSSPPACAGCHSTVAGVQLVGPSLAGLKKRAAALVGDQSYRGQAKDAAGYVRESILEPHAYVVPGPTYGAAGVSFMPANFGSMLKPEQIDQLVSYLMTLE
jgi:nitric oxide reductase subunit C